jgi:hypothetical protein
VFSYSAVAPEQQRKKKSRRGLAEGACLWAFPGLLSFPDQAFSLIPRPPHSDFPFSLDLHLHSLTN